MAKHFVWVYITLGVCLVLGILIQMGAGFMLFNMDGPIIIDIRGILIALTALLVIFFGLGFIEVDSYTLQFTGGGIQLPYLENMSIYLLYKVLGLTIPLNISQIAETLKMTDKIEGAFDRKEELKDEHSSKWKLYFK